MIEHALRWSEDGMSVIPLRGKVCPIQWARYQTTRPTFGQLHHWHNTGMMQNLGIVCGHVSDNLVVIDLDGLAAMHEFHQTFPHLLENTLRIGTGSGCGEHIYLRVETMPPTTRAKGFELRADGCYVVSPYSIHPDTGMQYLPVLGVETEQIRTVDNLHYLQAWIAHKVRSKRSEWTADVKATPVRNASAYGLAALRNACDKVRLTTAGGQNTELNRQAFKLGFMVERGHLSYDQVVYELASAAAELSERDGERATLATIRSGLNAGIDRSRNER